MRVSYHHANPGGGNESVLLKFDREDTDEQSVVMVDAGASVETPHIVGADSVDALCLTHAHSDHYQSIDRCVGSETRVYASPDTRAILGDVFDVAAVESAGEIAPTVTERFESITGWTEVAPGVEAHPVPAGHTPGAVGFCFRFEDDGETHHILFTGDFTFRRAAGYPGFDTDSLPDVDVLFLTVATDETFPAALSEGLARALQRAHSGSKTLVTTSGLFGVHAGYLLSHLGQQFDREVPVHLVGQAAKLYNALEYDCPNVRATELFTDPRECLEPGTITVAGPEVPTERSSGRLFGRLRNDPGATVVQLIGSGEEPIREAGCTLHDYEVVNHPARAELDTLHDEVSPVHTVVVHRHRGARGEFNDWASCVWSPDDSGQYTLYEDGTWTPPPWMQHLPGRRHSNGDGGQRLGELVGSGLDDLFSLPSLERHDDVDLEHEGIDLTVVEGVLDQRAAYGAREETAAAVETTSGGESSGESEDASVEVEPVETADGTSMNGTESGTDGNSDENEPADGTRLVRTTGADFDELDPALQRAIEDGSTTEEELRELHRAMRAGAAGAAPESEAAESAAETTSTAGKTPDTSESTPESSHEDASGDASSEADVDSDSEPEVETHADAPAPSAPDEHERTDTSAGAAPEDEPAGQEDVTAGTEDEPAGGVELDGLTVALASRVVGPDADLEAVLAESVSTYLESLLSGDQPNEDGAERIDVTGSPALLDALDAVVADDSRYRDREDLVTTALASVLAPEVDDPVEVESLNPYLSLLDTVVANERLGPTSRGEAVRTAVLSYVSER